MQVFLHASDLGVADVTPVDVGEQIHYPYCGEEAQIDFADQLFLFFLLSFCCGDIGVGVDGVKFYECC